MSTRENALMARHRAKPVSSLPVFTFSILIGGSRLLHATIDRIASRAQPLPCDNPSMAIEDYLPTTWRTKEDR
jgi:hypothetical protein